MSHMVIYRGADGKPGYHQTDDIHDAVGFVEQMRNDEGVEHARIFRLEEVVFEYRPYYRVELSASGAPMVLGAPPAPQLAGPEEPGTIAMPAAAPAAENGSGNGHSTESIDLVEDAIDVSDLSELSDLSDLSDDGQPKVDAGAGKKGLFGR